MTSSRGIALEHGCYYHIYNRRINGTPLYYAPVNYTHFLKLYNKYISPIADTYAWNSMGNHSHLLVRIEEENEIIINTLPNPTRVNASKSINPPHIYFSHLFNSYKQVINKQQHRTALLFERPFHRLKVTSGKYFLNLVSYLHQNPFHHGNTMLTGITLGHRMVILYSISQQGLIGKPYRRGLVERRILLMFIGKLLN